MKLSKEQQATFILQKNTLLNGVIDIVPLESFEIKLKESIVNNRPLKIKFGLDPTAPDVHLGHTVVINKLKQFQDFGHKIQIIIGDFTGKIGDPSDREATRKQLTDEEVIYNAKTYFEQISKIINKENIEVFYNSKWLKQLDLTEVLNIASSITLSRLLERKDFTNRFNNNKPIALHEFFYPLMQGYDSVALECDIEIGGTDQLFNLLMGRHLQSYYQQQEQVVLTLPLLEGLDGVQKMSKSKNNYVGIDESPKDMYGKLMSYPDNLMEKYINLVTHYNIENKKSLIENIKRNEIHPKTAKMQIAKHIVAIYHGEKEAEIAEQEFNNVFGKNALPKDIDEVKLDSGNYDTCTLLTEYLSLFNSKSEARRMMANDGVKINGKKIGKEQSEIKVENGMIVQVGKRKFKRIKV
ncbi:tyrosine--tRNA ligase [Macrococcus caseolyticus]|uniref:tyrosine--tRNA ligase n=1 Tax=Macrococcoides caseolyticum TaxID=69966 RepID=UPI000C335764|nr:tyrosine--tRNA ligase [Macrococcus caseolyticus]MDJ1109458.1 tyrosine--tRNA ligase [Macrococcus caseolyticus]PKE11014.1 tyrosine--tRNA ligase [Macrococcus caseolyticus]